MTDMVGGSFQLASGHSMPKIGLGTSAIREASAMNEAVKAALQSGYRLFDTAHGYRNEELLGNALETLLPSVGLSRADVFITTKVPINNANTVAESRATVEKSLRDLRVDYLDLVLVHYPRHLIGGGSDDDPENAQRRREVYGVLEEFVAQGKVRSIGVSNYEVYHMAELPEYAKVPCSVNQCEYHPHHTQNQLRVYCKKKGVVFQAFASLGSGNATMQEEEVVKELAAKHGVTPQTILLSFALHTDVGVLPKSTNPQRIENNLRSTVSVLLSDEDVKALLKLDKRKTYVGLCTPWRTI